MKRFIFSLIVAFIYIFTYIKCLNYVTINNELKEKIKNKKGEEEDNLHMIEMNEVDFNLNNFKFK